MADLMTVRLSEPMEKKAEIPAQGVFLCFSLHGEWDIRILCVCGQHSSKNMGEFRKFPVENCRLGTISLIRPLKESAGVAKKASFGSSFERFYRPAVCCNTSSGWNWSG